MRSGDPSVSFCHDCSYAFVGGNCIDETILDGFVVDEKALESSHPERWGCGAGAPLSTRAIGQGFEKGRATPTCCPAWSRGRALMKEKPDEAWPTVLAVIVTWNGRDDLARCLESVACQDYPSGRLEVLVVDNGSTDGSLEMCRSILPGAVWLRNSSTLGYTRAGVNVGLRHGMANGSRYVWGVE